MRGQNTAEEGPPVTALTIVLTIVAVWFLLLTFFVVQQLRRPRWQYPSPPARPAPESENREAA
jgi:cytochrome c-type biogenesis protein CcmH/NrfF